VVPNKYQQFYIDAVKPTKEDRNKYRDIFAAQLVQAGVRDQFTPEYQFHPTRKWRIDWAVVPMRLAVELNGGIFSRPVYCNHCGSPVTRTLANGSVVAIREGGRHNGSGGYMKDLEKINSLCCAGWRVLQFTSDAVVSGDAVAQVVTLLSLGYAPSSARG
jgi:very-short-patch-repair endonuclease